jgi:nickel/cobalt transporter (NiCoT) family protein
MFGFILALNAAGWGIYLLVVMPHHFDYRGEGGSPGLGVGLGVAVTAWFLGFRHAFDADHFKVFRDMRRGAYDESELEAQLQARGLMYRFFGRFMTSIRHPWQLYLVGLVFGIGFDTTTEVVLLAATAYAAIQGLPYYAVLALPFLFAGGLMLFDTLDGLFMNLAYGWAFARPVRKVYYNLVITGLSIGAAFIIGTIEILGVLTDKLHLSGAFWNTVATFNINTAGFAIVALFLAVWVAALAYWRFGRVEARWTADVDR